MLASLHPIQRRNHPDKVTKYQECGSELNISGVKHSVNIKDIDKFGHQNNISVNVFGCEDKKIFPLHITIIGIARHQVNLLYITAGEISHDVLLKDLSRLVSRQNNNHNNKKNMFYLNETRSGHRHQNLSSPNTNITYHVGAVST